MKRYLYKVAPPRDELIFYPSRFYRTSDWESSTTRPRDGYIEDQVLYAGDFDEVNIHLFPRVRTLRVRSVDADARRLAALGLRCSPAKTAYIFIHESCRPAVASFRPTIFRFDADGFVRVRRGEYVARAPQCAIAVETLDMADTVARWNVEPCYVENLDHVIDRLRRAGIYFDEQT